MNVFKKKTNKTIGYILQWRKNALEIMDIKYSCYNSMIPGEFNIRFNELHEQIHKRRKNLLRQIEARKDTKISNKAQKKFDELRKWLEKQL